MKQFLLIVALVASIGLVVYVSHKVDACRDGEDSIFCELQ